MTDYQVMPPLSDEEYADLKADIEERGVMVPIEFDEDGNVLDGHHRLKICEELEITDYPKIIRSGMSEEQKRTHARKLNMARRHLNREQKQELIREQLRETPERSDRQIGKELGVSDKTVGAQRKEMEANAEIPQCDRQTSDGRTYPRERQQRQEPEAEAGTEVNVESKTKNKEERYGKYGEFTSEMWIMAFRWAVGLGRGYVNLDDLSEFLEKQHPNFTYEDGTVDVWHDDIKQYVRHDSDFPQGNTVSATVEQRVLFEMPTGGAEDTVWHDEENGVELIRRAQKPHIANNSGDNEWYTPKKYIDAARAVMGNIDLDPASNDFANETVKADTYFTEEQDGTKQKWFGNVWLNPPYQTSLIEKFASKIEQKEFRQAIVLVNNASETQWYQKLWEHADAMVGPKGRIKFVKRDGEHGTPLQGQTFFYYGPDPEGFLKVFREFGMGTIISETLHK